MTTKTKPKSNVRKNNQQLTQFKFRWWMALILVVGVAVIGIVILRFSNASGGDGGWCDQYFAGHPSEAKVVCFFAIDDISSRDPNKVQTGVTLVQSPDPETGLTGAEAYYFDAAGYPEGTLIWGGPNRDLNNLSGKTLKACWWLRDISGSGRVNLVIKTNGNVIAQDNLALSGSSYSPYCISQNITSNLPNTTFELRLLSGSVRANRMEASATATPVATPVQPKPVIIAPVTINTVKPSSNSGRSSAIVSQDSVNGSSCILQVGFKNNNNFRACTVEPNKSLNVFAEAFIGFSGKNINICIGTLGASPTIRYYYRNQPVKNANGSAYQTTTKAGSEGLATLIACGKLPSAPQFDQIKISTPEKSYITSVTISQDL